MEKIALKIENLITEDNRIKALYILVRCYQSESDRKDFWSRVETLNVRPEWAAKENFENIHASFELVIPSKESRDECYEKIMSLLRTILYSISAIIPFIDDERAFNMALGNPLALWVYDYADHIDTICRIAAVLHTGSKMPQCLVRLPNATQRCREILFPVIEEVNKQSEAACNPEYLALFKYKSSDPK